MNTYNFSSTLVLRTPLLPLTFNFTNDELAACYSDPKVREAVYLASPELYSSLLQLEAKELGHKKIGKLTSSLLKYALRLCNRCTPFGLFAGVTSLRWDKNDQIVLPIMSDNARRTRLDMFYLVGLIQYLEKDPQLRQKLTYYPNTSIHRESTRIKYVETLLGNEGRYIHRISSVTKSAQLEAVLSQAVTGADIDQLVAKVVCTTIQPVEAQKFIHALIDSQLLVSELYPTVTGEDLFTRTINLLQKIANGDQVLQKWPNLLENILNQLQALDQLIGNKVSRYEALQLSVDQLPLKYNAKRLLQVDLFKPAMSASMSEDWQPKLHNALRVLNKLTPSIESNFSAFRKAFYERYEDRDISLLDALDVEKGIGYLQNHYKIDSELVDGLNAHDAINQHSINWNKYEAFYHRKAIESLTNRAQVVEILDSELKDFVEEESDLPTSICVFFKLLSEHGTPRLEIRGTFGASAIDIVGRFAYGDANIEQVARAIADYETTLNPDIIYAEIVHLPESRTGNILFRPVFRSYEITYLAASACTRENQISVDDLYIFVRQGRIVLKSRRLNKEIIPRLSNAHHFSYNALPIYQFLCDLQRQDQRTALTWTWGSLQREFTFLPRVIYQGVILALARWTLATDDILRVLQSPDRDLSIHKWKEQHLLPRLLMLVEGDNELLVDLESETSLQMLQDTIHPGSHLVFKEFLYEQTSGSVKDTENKVYANEFIGFLVKKEKYFVKKSNNTKRLRSTKEYNLHTFVPGSKWIYFKLYSGYLNGEKILTAFLQPLYDKLLEQKLIKKMFFIRYADPRPHLRVRFELTCLENFSIVIKYFNDLLRLHEINELLYNVQIDSYRREIDRYGLVSIDVTEALFHYDSVCAMKACALLKGANNNLRWVFAIKSIDALLKDFHMDLGQKVHILTLLKSSYSSEFKVHENKLIRKALANKYRRYSSTISAVLSNKEEINSLMPLWAILADRSSNNINMVESLQHRATHHSDEPSLDNLLVSYIHMICNRIFIYKHRLHEMVVYDFMYLEYRKQMNIAQKNSVDGPH